MNLSRSKPLPPPPPTPGHERIAAPMAPLSHQTVAERNRRILAVQAYIDYCWSRNTKPEARRLYHLADGQAPSPAGKIANTEKPGAAQSANPPANSDGQPPAPGLSDSLTERPC